MPRAARVAAISVIALLAGAALSGCGRSVGDQPSDLTTPPADGACRDLSPADLRHSADDTPVVDCTDKHTAETFYVGRFDGPTVGTTPDDSALAPLAYAACQQAFMDYLGADESIVKRSILTWAWFRPSELGWSRGARWFRCDVIGGGEQSKLFQTLPTTTKGLLADVADDRYMACADGPTVDGAVKVPCSTKHTWRAVATVVLGGPGDPYPGDDEVAATTRQYCSDQVGAWLGYPVADYEFGFTWFHEREWQAGNRRSICWARTTK